MVWWWWQVTDGGSHCTGATWHCSLATAGTEKHDLEAGMGKHGIGGHGRGFSSAAAHSVQSCSAGSWCGCHSGSQALQLALLARSSTSRTKRPCPSGPGEARVSPQPGSSEAWPLGPGWDRHGPAGSPCKRLSWGCSHPVLDPSGLGILVFVSDGAEPIPQGCAPLLVGSCPSIACLSWAPAAPPRSYTRRSWTSSDLQMGTSLAMHKIGLKRRSLYLSMQITVTSVW